ncbi:hypothetical protein MKW94_010201, partial [Papaver nudicaule]|nr:hypothetical protein [Papaver nudicaule]
GHPEAAGMKDKPLKFYEKWQVIIGNEQATGDRAVEAGDFFSPLSQDPTSDSQTQPDDFSGDSVPHDDFVDPISTQRDSNASGFTTTQPSIGPTQRRKRLRALEEGINYGITGMVEAANRIAATFEGPNWGKINTIFEAMPELEEDDIYQAAELFNKEPWMAQYFLSLSEGRKLAWIKMKLQKI